MAAPSTHSMLQCLNRSAPVPMAFHSAIKRQAFHQQTFQRPFSILTTTLKSLPRDTLRQTPPRTCRQSLSRTQTVRHASSSTSTPNTSAASPAPGASAQQTLTWDEFLQLRRQRRYINVIASLATAVTSVGVAVPAIAASQIEDTLAAMTGLDPFITIGMTLTAVGGVGWLMGPFVGNAVFGLWKRGLRSEIARREKLFYAHIKRYRADAMGSSVSNPVPDYYGEKIRSVADYRRWLKDQRAFVRKKNKNLL